ncbi:MAG: tetratricopeptide repeat protein [Thiotrichales bacterium]|jgi:tetratricopeptide (TPR) repeat protein|nr:tetratricopeptide repeat protein [Thiotrichales bacterium]
MNKFKRKLLKADNLIEQNDLFSAEKILRKVFNEAQGRYRVDAAAMLGVLLEQKGEYENAIHFLEEALKILPNDEALSVSLGAAWIGVGEYQKATVIYNKVLSINSLNVSALNGYAGSLYKQGDKENAKDYFLQALKIEDNSQIYYNLGFIYLEEEDYSNAEFYFKKSLELNDKYEVAYLRLAYIYSIQDMFPQSELILRTCLKLFGESYDSYNDLGAVLHDQWKILESIEAYNRALQFCSESKECVTAKKNLAYNYLTLGRLDLGWPYYEYRRTEDIGGHSGFKWKAWWGEDDISESHILLYHEQGIGDTVTFASCVAEVVQKARHCTILVQYKLEKLFERSFPEATVISLNEKLMGGETTSMIVRGKKDVSWIESKRKIDYQVALGSLPSIFRKNIDLFPECIKYLKVDDNREKYWKSKVSLLGAGLKIGICWTSSNQKGAAAKDNLKLADWISVLKIKGVDWIDLQYNGGDDEIKLVASKFGVKIHQFKEVDMFDDLDETAALISVLDLVLSPSTAVDMIADAVGVPVLQLYYGGEWWGMGKEYHQFHPNIRNLVYREEGVWRNVACLVEPTANFLEMILHAEVPLKTLWLSWVEEYIRTGRFIMAEKYLRKVLTQYPDDHESNFLLNRVLVSRENIITRYGKFICPSSYDILYSSLKKYGEYAGCNPGVYEQLIQSGATVIDIGAGIGANTVVFSKLVGAGNVVAVELEELSQNLLYINLLQNNIKNVTLLIEESWGDSLENITQCDFIRVDASLFNVNVLDKLDVIVKKYKPLLFIEGLSVEELSKVKAYLYSIKYDAVSQDALLYIEDNFNSSSENIFEDRLLNSFLGVPAI